MTTVSRPIDPRRWLLQQNAYELLQKLKAAATGSSPGPEVVHGLRTSTRRSGALLESLLATPGRSRELRNHDKQKQARKLLRLWKKLRRTAGTARDLDVHIGLLEKLREAELKTSTTSTPVLQPQFEALETWLKRQRGRKADVLQDEAKKRLDRCRALTVTVLGEALPAVPTVAPAPRRTALSPAKLALEDFYGASQANPHLDLANLHDFRKATKQARYVAEAGQQQPDAVAVDKALKRIQDVIGDWHDLDALHAEARNAMGKDGLELKLLLHSQAEKKMKLAIESTERMRRRLLGERLALRSHRQPKSNSQG